MQRISCEINFFKYYLEEIRGCGFLMNKEGHNWSDRGLLLTYRSAACLKF
jgi:hypothetical protein